MNLLAYLFLCLRDSAIPETLALAVIAFVIVVISAELLKPAKY